MTVTASKITYRDKVRKGTPGAIEGETDTFRAVDANEIKSVVNEMSDAAADAYNMAESLYTKVNPFELALTMNQEALQRIASGAQTLSVVLNWTCQVDGKDVQVSELTLSRGGVALVTDPHIRTYTDVINVPTSPDELVWTLTAKYDVGNQQVTVTKNIKFVAASYYGVVDVAPGSITANILKALTDATKGDKALSVGNVSMAAQRYAYAYPKSFGALTSITDGVMQYINSFTRSELEIDGVDYYVYVLTDPVTVSNFTYNFA
jgi:hypothetical protein